MMANAVYRSTPGCALACPRCTIRCAVVVATRDEIWQEIECLRSGNHPVSDQQVRALALAIDELEDAERALEQVRPQFPAIPPQRSSRAGYRSALVH